MSNLGDSNTPIEGESFGLPSGWAIVENGDGEVVIEDSGGNVVFRRDETAGEWVTDSIDAESVSVGSGTIEQENTSPDSIVRFSQLAEAEDLVEVDEIDDLGPQESAGFAFVHESNQYVAVYKDE